MDWKRSVCRKTGVVQQYGIVSGCGRFHIAKWVSESGFDYALFDDHQKGEYGQHKTQGWFKSAEEAKQLAAQIKKAEAEKNRAPGNFNPKDFEWFTEVV